MTLLANLTPVPHPSVHGCAPVSVETGDALTFLGKAKSLHLRFASYWSIGCLLDSVDGLLCQFKNA